MVSFPEEYALKKFYYSKLQSVLQKRKAGLMAPVKDGSMALYQLFP